MPEHYLRGQNVIPRHPPYSAWRSTRRARRPLRALAAVAVPSALLLGSFALGRQFPARPEAPTGSWRLNVVFEPEAPNRVLGAEPPHDSDSCTVHVAAEVPYLAQLAAVQSGMAACFAATFTREPSDG